MIINLTHISPTICLAKNIYTKFLKFPHILFFPTVCQGHLATQCDKIEMSIEQQIFRWLCSKRNHLENSMKYVCKSAFPGMVFRFQCIFFFFSFVRWLVVMVVAVHSLCHSEWTAEHCTMNLLVGSFVFLCLLFVVKIFFNFQLK